MEQETKVFETPEVKDFYLEKLEKADVVLARRSEDFGKDVVVRLEDILRGLEKKAA